MKKRNYKRIYRPGTLVRIVGTNAVFMSLGLKPQDKRQLASFNGIDVKRRCAVSRANYYTVSRKAKRLGVQKTDAFMRSSWQKGSKPWTMHGEERRRFKTDADAYMREHFADTDNATLAAHFGVDVKTVRRWARRLGLQKTDEFMRQARGRRANTKYYTPEQETYRLRRVAEVYPDGTEEELQELAKELGVKRNTLAGLAQKCGIRRSEARIKEIRRKSQKPRTVFTPELVAEIASYYPTHSTAECAAHFGVNLGSLQQVAIRNKWRKDKDYLHSIRRQARDGKKIKIEIKALKKVKCLTSKDII